MAIKTSSRVEKFFKFISVVDDAIDWELCQCSQDEYAQSHDILALSFFKDKKPTVFVFANPQEVSSKTKILDVTTKGYAKDSLVSSMHEVFKTLLLGLADDLQADFKQQMCTQDFLQALDEQNIITEAAQVLLTAVSPKK